MSSLGSRKLAQVAIVVKDIDAAITRFSALLSVEPPNVIVTQPGNSVNQTYRGASTNDQAKLAFFDLGGVQLELIEPIGDDSAWAEGLRNRGEGVHHIAFWTENMTDSARFLGQNGAPLIMRGDMGDGQYAYFDGQEQFGVMIEMLEKVRTPIS